MNKPQKVVLPANVVAVAAPPAPRTEGDVAADGEFPTEADVAKYFEAAREGDVKVVGKLLQRGMDVNMAGQAFTALRVAPKYDHAELVRMLLQRGANVELLTEQAPTPSPPTLSRSLRSSRRKTETKTAPSDRSPERSSSSDGYYHDSSDETTGRGWSRNEFESNKRKKPVAATRVETDVGVLITNNKRPRQVKKRPASGDNQGTFRKRSKKLVTANTPSLHDPAVASDADDEDDVDGNHFEYTTTTDETASGRTSNEREAVVRTKQASSKRVRRSTRVPSDGKLKTLSPKEQELLAVQTASENAADEETSSSHY